MTWERLLELIEDMQCQEEINFYRFLGQDANIGDLCHFRCAIFSFLSSGQEGQQIESHW